jgi:transmembrane sensor|tara:strand:- start:763 stop:1833 length:1071 start_codon:yes stop_codon:yes gene_type:complete
MTRIVSIFSDDERLEAATRWVLRIDEGISDADEKSALDDWFNEDPRHKEALLEVAAVWDKTDTLTRLADIFTYEAKEQRAVVAHQRRDWSIGLAVAASLAVIAISAVMLMPRLGSDFGIDTAAPTQTASYETAIGRQKTVLLPDGSEVILNTNTQISLLFTSSARVIHLTRGEAHVKVAKDEFRPLSVIAADRIVQAIGTEFTVEITEDRLVEVLVTEGKVVIGIQPLSDLRNIDAAALPPVIEAKPDNTLLAGEAVVLGASDSVIKPITSDDIEVKLSWKKERLVFRSDPLQKVLDEVERYTTVEFVLLDDELKTEVVSGIFRTGDVEGLLASLELNGRIVHKFDNENRVLLRSQ